MYVYKLHAKFIARDKLPVQKKTNNMLETHCYIVRNFFASSIHELYMSALVLVFTKSYFININIYMSNMRTHTEYWNCIFRYCE